jgi:para-aminobenzoate synthetase component 1
LETYANVHHLVSIVEANLKSDKDMFDVIRATFPGGSITGAPKIKAMEIIAQQEKIPRGVYCGSIGYLSFDGRMDLNIAIRTATITPKEILFSAGGGITLLSDPEAEYRETLIKAERLFKAFDSEGVK